MAVKLPLVITAGVVQQLQSGDTLDIRAEAFNLTNGEATPVVIGAPVYMFGAASFKKAQANAAGTAKVVGLVAASPSIANGVSGSVVLDGTVSLTTAQWDAITGGSGGLVFDTKYYLDPATAGKLTSTAPTTVGQLVVEVGIAMSTVDLKLNIQSGILL